MAQRNNGHKLPIDGIEMARADHQKIRDLFQEYQTIRGYENKQKIAEQIFLELEVHAQLEEQVFYPAFAQQANAAGKELVAESLEEHQAVKDLIEELRQLNIDDEEFAAKFQELRRNVEHHVEEEESEMLPEAEEVLAEQAEDLMDEMEELKQQILAFTNRV